MNSRQASRERKDAIREMLPSMSRKEIAARLGITTQAIGQIIRRHRLLDALHRPHPTSDWLASERERGNTARAAYRAEKERRTANSERAP